MPNNSVKLKLLHKAIISRASALLNSLSGWANSNELRKNSIRPGNADLFINLKYVYKSSKLVFFEKKI
ncbi:hypothetical protein MYP_3444 [Sporocytophaga myxococcoides]|uniref:Uncharacterized protein n=1 Tax=Sporocytophaga myxococcoides TaxID=153721 RepID=A0A098LGT8_9BACT|nr:hypothetical protein MYP_3444 [Sporocytophaga myxococcoides]